MLQIDITKSTQDFADYNEAEIYAFNCFEETMYKLVRDPNLDGELPISFPNIYDKSCDVSIENDISNPQIKIITIKANNNNYYYKIIKKVDTSVDLYIVTTIT